MTGFGAGHSDASWNRELARILGISTVPSIVGIVNGRVYHFHGSDFTTKQLREFARKLIPARTVALVNQDNINSTLTHTIAENRVFALFVSNANQLTLRFQVPCFQLSNFIKCAYIKQSNLGFSI